MRSTMPGSRHLLLQPVIIIIIIIIASGDRGSLPLRSSEFNVVGRRRKGAERASRRLQRFPTLNSTSNCESWRSSHLLAIIMLSRCASAARLRSLHRVLIAKRSWYTGRNCGANKGRTRMPWLFFFFLFFSPPPTRDRRPKALAGKSIRKYSRVCVYT